MKEKKKFVSWRRVSTFKQGRSGLGMAAQKDIIDGFIDFEGGELIADYEEVYTGTELECCTELAKAMQCAKSEGATLIIAKTDRFRETKEALQIYDEMNGNVYFCDCPTQDKFTLTLLFAIAEREAMIIGMRTKAALAAKRKREGSWSSEYGKHTGTTREDALEKAREVRAKNARAKAMTVTANKDFILYIRNYESKNGAICRTTNIVPIVDELNSLGYTTATGLSFDVPRFRAMYAKVKKFLFY